MSSRRSGQWNSSRLTWAATLTLLVGIAPLVANLLASQIASLLGCYIAEYSIYSKAGTSADFSDDLPACLAGSRNVDALLIGAHNFGLAFAFTWPFVLVSAFLWLRLLMRRVPGS